jgi:16S rRNA G966 N2-methylase RsmD
VSNATTDTATNNAGAALSDDIKRVLASAHYQKFVLPGGIETSGFDRSATANAIFDFDVTGKSLLDIGARHGYYCMEAKKRGAGHVVGVEESKRRCEVARAIQKLFGYADCEFIAGRFPDVFKGIMPKMRMRDGMFDVVLLLNVVHHLATVERAAAMVLDAARAAADRLILCIQPPWIEVGGVEHEKKIVTMETVEVWVDMKTGRKRTEPRALLTKDYLRELLRPVASAVEFKDAPDYPGRFITVAKK